MFLTIVDGCVWPSTLWQKTYTNESLKTSNLLDSLLTALGFSNKAANRNQ